MPVIYADADYPTGSEYRNRHGEPKNGAHQLATPAMGGHVMWDADKSDINQRVRDTKVTSAAATPNTRVRMTKLSQEHPAGTLPG